MRLLSVRTCATSVQAATRGSTPQIRKECSECARSAHSDRNDSEDNAGHQFELAQMRQMRQHLPQVLRGDIRSVQRQIRELRATRQLDHEALGEADSRIYVQRQCAQSRERR